MRRSVHQHMDTHMQSPRAAATGRGQATARAPRAARSQREPIDALIGQDVDRSGRKVVVDDRMQRGYVYYRREPIGRNFAPEFGPQLTPQQLLQLGVFGGKYMTDCRDEFPASWFTRAKLSPVRRDARLNYFGIHASQSLAIWRRNGWIHPQDPRGWFQWYCRYYMGRRTRDDERQIRRWRAMARHVAAIRNHCEPGDLECRRRQRQAVLHWAYDSRTI